MSSPSSRTPGRRTAPAGLGRNVDELAVASAGVEFLATPVETRDVHGCPSGITKKDYYCFYWNADFGGRRMQFSDTCADHAKNWGFDNTTTSWVSNDVDKEINTYNYSDATGLLWGMPEKSMNSNVGAAKNDRMSFWRCT